ncbi:hypothetical protein M9458_048364, partial [Cirrhinus mrigala]
TVQMIWEIFGKAEVDLFASEDYSHYPIYYLKDRDALVHEWPNLLLYAFPPTVVIPQIMKRIRERGHRVLLVAPPLEEPTLVVRANSAACSSPSAHFSETGPPLSSEQDDMAPPAQAVGSIPAAAQREPASLPEHVLNTISEARSPSTRRLYAH